MQKIGSDIILSATDLSAHLACRHVTTLNLLLINKKIQPPKVYPDATLSALIKKGEEFEAAYLQQLKNEGKFVVSISRESKNASEETIKAMQSGADIIYQARLGHGIWKGWADFLIRVNKPSSLGSWSYEVEDTKFARNTKAGAILQISLYSQLLEHMQGVQPEYMHIRTPDGGTPYRVDEYISYFRLVQKKLLNAIQKNSEETYPEPVVYCEICRWWETCNKQRRTDDHLGFIAGMGSAQTREVKRWGINTLKSMAVLPLPITHKPSRGNVDTYTKLREQARVQFQARETQKKVYELLDPLPDRGLFRLPDPSPGDMFFDFEGDPFVTPGGREYLFGWVYQDAYEHLWAFTEAEEKKAFENFIDRVISIRHQFPEMHIYHYSPYETAAIKRLMGKHATREHEVDTLLRAGVFVDLHLVTRHSLRAGIESYSLKVLEQLHEFERLQDLRQAGNHRAYLETLLENGLVPDTDGETMMVVKEYNKEDCLSTESLRDWLEDLRARQIEAGHTIPRPVMQSGEASENLKDYQVRAKPLFEALMRDISADAKDRNAEQQAKWLLANMLEWYHREDKSFWWNFHRLRELPDEDLLDERDAIAMLRFTGRIAKAARSEVHYYTFPEQDADIRLDSEVAYNGEQIGTLYSIDWQQGLLSVKKKSAAKDIHPTHIINADHIEEKSKRDAIFRLAEWVSKNGMPGNGAYKAGRDLLMKIPPSAISSARQTVSLTSTTMSHAQQRAIYSALQLKEEVLPIQGPPGTGKSFTAARMIIELLKSGKKIGITALSHKVITALLQKVYDLCIEQHINVSIIQKVKEKSRDMPDGWVEATKNSDVSVALKRDANIAAGTSYMWSREEFFEMVDVMFVDEAGQLALIDTLALSHAGRSLVLLGDPQQLQQPQQGVHPEGTEVSALKHILGPDQTIGEEKGVLLDITYRLHPAICDYTSALFYENRLKPMPMNVHQRLQGETRYSKPGIYIETVVHFGNKNDSPEEVDRVHDIVNDLLNQEVYFIDSREEMKRLTARDIKVISPYNAQVNALQDAIPNVDIGTVDKFQGQEAAVVIFSMATSTPEDAPRGMEFLYSLNRLNVAVSRARAVFILVASETLLQPDCRTPQQVKLANALCSLVERAER